MLWRFSSWKLIVLLGLLAVLAMTLILACGTESTATPEPTATSVPEPTATPKPFVIGVMESLTGPGETYGTVANQAKQMAVDEINEAGGIDGA